MCKSIFKIWTLVIIKIYHEKITLVRQLLTKYEFFTKWPEISYTQKNHNFNSIIGNWSDTPTASTLYLMAGTCKESTFSFLAVLSP